MIRRGARALVVLMVLGCEDVSVSSSVVATIEVSPDPVEVPEGEFRALSATLRERGGRVLTGRSVSWSTGDPDIAAVSDGGVVEGRAVGTTRVRATADGVEGSADVIVSTGPVLELGDAAVQLRARAGQAQAVSVDVEVTNGGGGTLGSLGAAVEMDDAPGAGWLGASLLASAAPTLVRITARAQDLGVGAYRGRVVVSSPSARGGPRTVEVTFEVEEPPPRIRLDPTSVSFSAVARQPQAATQVVLVQNAGGQVLDGLTAAVRYPPNSQTGWLTTELDRTRAPAELTLIASAQGFTGAGTHTATVEVSSPVAENESEEVAVTFIVSGAAASSATPRSPGPLPEEEP